MCEDTGTGPWGILAEPVAVMPWSCCTGHELTLSGRVSGICNQCGHRVCAFCVLQDLEAAVAASNGSQEAAPVQEVPVEGLPPAPPVPDAADAAPMMPPAAQVDECDAPKCEGHALGTKFLLCTECKHSFDPYCEQFGLKRQSDEARACLVRHAAYVFRCSFCRRKTKKNLTCWATLQEIHSSGV